MRNGGKGKGKGKSRSKSRGKAKGKSKIRRRRSENYLKLAGVPRVRYTAILDNDLTCTKSHVCICKRNFRNRAGRFAQNSRVSDGIFGCGKKPTKKETIPDSKNCDKVKPTPKEPEPTPAPEKPVATETDKKVCMPRSRNPFIIFFLSLHCKNLGKRMSALAREAGELWSKMTPEEKECYRSLAKREQRKRRLQKHKTKRKRRVKKSRSMCGKKTPRKARVKRKPC